MCERADDQLKVLDLQESDYQTDNGKSKKLTSELSSINDKVSNKEGTVRKQQELVEKVRKMEYRLARQRQKPEEEQQALELLLEERKGVNARLCRMPTENALSPTMQQWLPRDASQRQVSSFVSQLSSDSMLHRAFLALAGPILGKEQETSTQYAQDMRLPSAASKQARSSRTWMQLCLLLGLLKGVGSTAPFSAPCHLQWNMQRTYRQSLPGQSDLTPKICAMYRIAASRECLGRVDGVGEVPVINLTSSPSGKPSPED